MGLFESYFAIQIIQAPNKALLSPLSRLGQPTLRSSCPKAWRYVL